MTCDKTKKNPIATRLLLLAVVSSGATASQLHAAEIDLANFSASDGSLIRGSQHSAHAGQGVMPSTNLVGYGGGIVITEPGTEKVHVVFGSSASLPPVLDLDDLNGSNGFTITGIGVGFGNNERTISTSFDTNNDTYPDVAIGGYDGVNILYGGSMPFAATQSIEQLETSGRAVRIDPDNNHGPFTSIDFYLDYDISDVSLLISSKTGTASGKSYALSTAGLANTTPVNLNNYNGYNTYGSVAALGDIDGDWWNNFAIVGGKFSNFGFMYLSSNQYLSADREIGNISGIGDIDSDGIVDFAVGVRSDAPHKPIAYVVYGKSFHQNQNFPQHISLSAMTPDQGFAIRVNDNIDSFGYVADSGDYGADIDGDGIKDLVVGSAGTGPNGQPAKGKVYVVFGQTDRSQFGSAVDVTTTNGYDTATIVAATPGDGVGSKVALSSISSDILIGARNADRGYKGGSPGYGAGAVYLIKGKPRPW